MNTYYKNDNGNFIQAEISSEDAIAILIQSAVTNAVNKVNTLIINEVISRVNDAVSDANIKGKVETHLDTLDTTHMIDEAVSNAVNEYDYDDVIETALGEMDIDEMVTEKVTDHLDSCSIQVRIN
jgi:hypothetical protein